LVSAITLITQEVTANQNGTTPVNQTLALKHLYDSTTGPEWVFYDGDPWVFSQPLELTEPCNGWDGITCQCINTTTSSTYGNGNNDSEVICNIVELTMFWTGLKGALPGTLSMLQHLSILNLGFNYLTSTLPPAMFNLTALVNLNLGYNSLTGTIPQEVTQAKGMLEFNVFFNMLSGTVPADIDSWTQLEVRWKKERKKERKGE
jgi:hypothetical protein